MFLICMQLGLRTPPFGMPLFTMRGIAPQSIATRDVFAVVLPSVSFGQAMLVSVVLFPPLATWLRSVLLGRQALGGE